jgi:serine/threonine protein kinase
VIKKRYQRVSDIFQEVVQRPLEQRLEFLNQACGDDGDLRAEVENLLNCDREPDATAEFDPGPAFEAMRSALSGATMNATEAPIPERIGRYRPIHVLGQGGMGIVYEAEQDRPKRRVALKILARRAVSPQALRRFRQEAEILGRLKHPGIAQIYECGSLGQGDTGEAYLAMELVEGRTLTKHVAKTKPSIEQRLELFASICDAVHHAHQKGVIHRDLKPDNILVTQDGAPKILDFGIARVTEADLQVTTMHTQHGQLVGTITYMSPEQVSGNREELDLRSDIYALGVVLFELLAGRLPHDLAGRSIPDAVRIILEVNPQRLSSIDTVFRGDVDVIVAKALERDAARRYASAAEIAADIRRHLSHEPISARPASTFYQLRKFAKRHKAIVAGVIATVMAFIVGLVFSIHFALRESHQRELADAASVAAKTASSVAEVSEFQSRRSAYRAKLLAAMASIDASNPSRARKILDDTDPRFRGWEWEHTNALLERRIAFYPSECEADVATREDGTLVAMVVQGGQPKIIDMTSGSTIFTVDSTSPLEHLRLSGDGLRILAISTGEVALRSWDANTGVPISRCVLDDSQVYALAPNWNGTLAVIATHDQSSIIRPTDGAVLQRNKQARRRSVASFDRTGAWYAKHDNYPIELWHRNPNGEFSLKASREVQNATSIACDGDAKRVAVGLRFGQIHIMDTPTLNTSRVRVCLIFVGAFRPPMGGWPKSFASRR